MNFIKIFYDILISFGFRPLTLLIGPATPHPPHVSLSSSPFPNRSIALSPSAKYSWIKILPLLVSVQEILFYTRMYVCSSRYILLRSGSWGVMLLLTRDKIYALQKYYRKSYSTRLFGAILQFFPEHFQNKKTPSIGWIYY